MAALISAATRSALVSTLASERGRLNTAYAAHAAQADLYGEEDPNTLVVWARVERIRNEVQKLEDTLLALDPTAPEALDYMTGRRKAEALRRRSSAVAAVIALEDEPIGDRDPLKLSQKVDAMIAALSPADTLAYWTIRAATALTLQYREHCEKMIQIHRATGAEALVVLLSPSTDPRYDWTGEAFTPEEIAAMDPEARRVAEEVDQHIRDTTRSNEWHQDRERALRLGAGDYCRRCGALVDSRHCDPHGLAMYCRESIPMVGDVWRINGRGDWWNFLRAAGSRTVEAVDHRADTLTFAAGPGVERETVSRVAFTAMAVALEAALEYRSEEAQAARKGKGMSYTREAFEGRGGPDEIPF